MLDLIAKILMSTFAIGLLLVFAGSMQTDADDTVLRIGGWATGLSAVGIALICIWH